MVNHKSLFHSYTLEEGYHSSRAWAMLALAACSAVLMALGLAARASSYGYYVGSDLSWSAGVVYGFGGAGCVAFFVMFLLQARLAGLARKAYKRSHPAEFDTAGDPIEKPAAA